MMTILESGMSFGPYPEEICFYIEKSDVYQKIKDGVPMVEFCLFREKKGKPMIWLVEAKSSTPHPHNKDDFKEFIDQIRDKWVDALVLMISIILKRHCYELPKSFQSLSLSKFGVKFVLVVHGYQEAWLSPLQDALKCHLRSTLKTWAFEPTSVVVLNEIGAQKYGLVQPSQG